MQSQSTTKVSESALDYILMEMVSTVSNYERYEDCYAFKLHQIGVNVGTKLSEMYVLDCLIFNVCCCAYM